MEIFPNSTIDKSETPKTVVTNEPSQLKTIDSVTTLNNYGKEWLIDLNTSILIIIGIETKVKISINEGLVIIRTHEGDITINKNFGDVRVESGTRTKVDVQINYIYEAVVDKALQTMFTKPLEKINTESLTPADGRYKVRLGNLPPLYVKDARQVLVTGVRDEGDTAAASCSICMNDFEDNHQDACFLGCPSNTRHWFHFSCVRIWMTKQVDNCPICKRTVQQINRIADPSTQPELTGPTLAVNYQPIASHSSQNQAINPLSLGLKNNNMQIINERR